MARRHGSHATMQQEEAWFAPKLYGYGAGMPIAWQGWVATLVYTQIVLGAALGILPHSVFAFVAIMLGATAAFLVIAFRKTRGGWRWRWGERD